MREVIALEDRIRDALPNASTAADQDVTLRPLVAVAHDILCNGWTGPGARIDGLRTIAGAIARFSPQGAE